MKNNQILALALTTLLGVAFAPAGFAQALIFSDWTSPSDMTTFTISAPDDVLSTGDGTGYTSNLNASLAALFPAAIPGIFSNYAAGEGGWILSDSTGVAVIAQDATTLADPLVSYSTNFVATSGSGGGYTQTYDSFFSPTTFNGADEDASLGVTLTDGTSPRAGVSETATQTAQLINTLSNPNTSVTLSPITLADNLTVPNSGPRTNAQFVAAPADGTTVFDPAIVGTYNELVVTVNGTYSAGAQVGLTGEAEVTTADVSGAPEPTTNLLLMMTGIGALAYRLRRSLFPRN